ncbi:MAG: LLM class flavin-dependent oxidoreductase [Streptosporangiales bacterium]|nr:LLM class flavin-dependent oxidoreductase [Streptosporangiales bacterium]
MSGIEISVQAQPEDAASWAALARRVEDAGFGALLVADHPGVTASPFVALAAAAGVTSRIGLGTYVSQAGVREPLLLASDVATLDVVSGGRARLGIGAGHTPVEWAMLGAARERASRVGADPADLLAVPYVWIGTEEEILAELAAHRERWGITRYVVRDAAVDAVAPLLARLAAGGRTPRGGGDSRVG